MKKPFWENIYKELNGEYLFKKGKPSKDIVGVSEKLREESSVLDIGCGDGRNSIYLAKKGFKVTAFDISKYAIKKIKYIAKKEGLQINAFVQDMTTFSFLKKFDLIINHGSLHLIERSEWSQLIKKMKENTNKNGYNIHAVFTDTIEPPEELRPFCKGLFREGEIFEYYNDWIIELKQSYVLEDEHPGGIKHKHMINKIVAKKVE